MQLIDLTLAPRDLETLLVRRRHHDAGVESRVREILDAVRNDGDVAVTNYARQLDCRFIDSLGLRVTKQECVSAYDNVGKKFLKALRLARTNITRFHKKQKPASLILKDKGMKLTHRVRALDRVGIYIPGGKAAYPSTVLMNAIPAGIAGVAEIAMMTPCNAEGKINPEVLVAASECGITEIYRIGGVHAIGALAFGTESIRKVDKITGPGNAYVTAAKRRVFGEVGIDSLAGPTEVVVVADGGAEPAFVAADLIAQAEHDEEASPVCIVVDRAMAQRVELEIAMQLEKAERKAIARRSLDQHGAIIVAGSIRQAADVVNAIAPEHLEVMVKNPDRFAARIRNAGAIFVGPWSTEALGDYIVGTNHTLPTNGTARFASPLGVHDFVKWSNIVEVSRRRFEKLGPAVEVLALAEGLDGHASSVRIRRKT